MRTIAPVDAAREAGIDVSSHPVERFATSRPNEPERMDAPDVPQEEIDTAFGFIRQVNRWLGGSGACIEVFRRECSRWPRDRPMRWLDLGTGAADIPLAVDRWAVRRGVRVECVALDHHPACLAVARAAVGDHPRIRVLAGDALSLESPTVGPALEESCGAAAGCPPFAAGSFDYVHAGMFLHHLDDADVVRVLRSMGRIATRGVIWNDLLRSRWSACAVRLATFGRPSIVRDDAILSVEKGFTVHDAREAARWAGLDDVHVRTKRLVGRFVLTGRRS